MSDSKVFWGPSWNPGPFGSRRSSSPANKTDRLTGEPYSYDDTFRLARECRMRASRHLTVDDRLVAIRLIQPGFFLFLNRFLHLVAADDLPAVEPWSWLVKYEDDLYSWAEIVAKQCPSRSLVPFAKHQDTDDVFCFDGDDRTGNPPVLIIHTFASPGTEYRGQWTSFDVWWEEMEEHRAAWLVDQATSPRGSRRTR